VSAGAEHTVILWPAIVFFIVSLAIVAGMIVLSYLLGQRHRERATGEPYESGIVSTGTARMRFDVRFYMVGMFFVIFDLEAVFIFSWAVALRESGWTGFGEMLVFIILLVAVLFYLWRIGGLDWGPMQQKFIPGQDKE
jgi:NADH-quinone oxidoreductase subunit A